MEKIIFLNPSSNSTEKDLVLNEIINMIDTTDEYLSIAIAYFTHTDIANALIRRTKNGRKSQLILNTSDLLRPINSDQTKIIISRNLIELLKLGDPLNIKSLGFRSKTTYSNMHHKFIVSDRKAIFGSLNWTQTALQNNYEVVIVSENAYIIKEFNKEFDFLWEISQRLYFQGTKIRSIICPICKYADGIDFESYGPFCTFCGHQFKIE